MASRHGKKAKKLSVEEHLDADSDVLNLIRPTTSLNSEDEEQDKLSSDSEDNEEDEEDEEGEGEDEEEGSAPMPSPPPTVSKKRKRTRKSESIVSRFSSTAQPIGNFLKRR